MTPGSPKPERRDSLSDGASEAEAARPVDFEKDKASGPDAEAGAGSEPADAEDAMGAKGPPKRREGAPAPGTVAPEDLSTETDDGAS